MRDLKQDLEEAGDDKRVAGWIRRARRGMETSTPTTWMVYVGWDHQGDPGDEELIYMSGSAGDCLHFAEMYARARSGWERSLGKWAVDFDEVENESGTGWRKVYLMVEVRPQVDFAGYGMEDPDD